MRAIDMTLNHGEELLLKVQEFTVKVMYLTRGISVEVINTDRDHKVNIVVD